MTDQWFREARYGMIVHYGLYSGLERGEWVLNRENIPLPEYKKLAESFDASNFDAGALCDMAVRSGMLYVALTTMHHDGFRLYDTELSDFNSMRCCGRDLTQEFVDAARERGLRIALYHSLNNWTDQPDAVAALEGEADYEKFIENTFARIRELVTRFNPIDVLWYDGWWPFNAEKWRGEEMNAMVRAIQPHILFNGRNGLPGDFATPEGHLGAPNPWRPWEACMTLNDSWGYHRGDHNWKSPGTLIDMLATCAQGQGNLLMNVGPRGDGSVPEESVRIFHEVGDWLKRNGECIFETERFVYSLEERGDSRGDWNHIGPFTAKGNNLYWLARRWYGGQATFNGLENQVRRVTLLDGGREFPFVQTNGRVTVSGLPQAAPDPLCSVLRFECDGPPALYSTGGLRTPRVPHPPYDPCPSDIAH